MKTSFLAILLWLAVVPGYAVYSQTEAQRWIAELDKTITFKQYYIDQKWKKIDSLKTLLKRDYQQNLDLRFQLYTALFEEYKSFVYDSAFNCATELLNTAYLLKDRSKINRAKVNISFTLLSSGMFKEALDTLGSIDVNVLSKEEKVTYYNIYARTYFDLADYAQDGYFSEIYSSVGNKHLSEAIRLSDPTSSEYMFLKGWEYMRARNIAGAINTFQNLLQHYTISEHDYAIATSSLSYMYKINQQADKAKEFLAKAAIADIKAAVCETSAIRDLAELLYTEGDIKHAHTYVKIALDDAYFYGAKYRKIQITNIFPIIEAAQLKIIEGQKNTLLYYVYIVSGLSILVILFAVITYRQFTNLRTAKVQLNDSNENLREINFLLQDANQIKEEYIGQFFKTLSEYIEKIEKIKTSVERKISQKKPDEIRDITNAINPDSERNQMYATFDAIFLKIFPRFIEQFNKFFKPEDQFKIGEGEPLPPELRIFALIRLGIQDNEKIAKILRYSVNTIYTYKTRVRNKSVIPNEQFEEKLMEIKAL